MATTVPWLAGRSRGSDSSRCTARMAALSSADSWPPARWRSRSSRFPSVRHVQLIASCAYERASARGARDATLGVGEPGSPEDACRGSATQASPVDGRPRTGTPAVTGDDGVTDGDGRPPYGSVQPTTAKPTANNPTRRSVRPVTTKRGRTTSRLPAPHPLRNPVHGTPLLPTRESSSGSSRDSGLACGSGPSGTSSVAERGRPGFGERHAWHSAHLARVRRAGSVHDLEATRCSRGSSVLQRAHTTTPRDRSRLATR